MISAGEKMFYFPKIDRTCVPIDIDPSEFLPNVSNYPIAPDTRNDTACVYSEASAEGQNQLRFRFNSTDMSGLFGHPTKGISDYSIVLTQDGNLYAQEGDGAKGKTYNVVNPDRSGDPRRIAYVLAEVVAGLEIGAQLANPEIVRKNPAYELALWLDTHRTEAGKTIPPDLLKRVSDLAKDSKELSVDIDQVGTFPPSLGVVAVTPQTTINRVLFSADTYLDKPVIRFVSRSEVDSPELGQKRTGSLPLGVLDAFGSRAVLLTEQGIRVFPANEALKWDGQLKSTIPNERLAAILAGGLVALGSRMNPPELAKKITKNAFLVVSNEEAPLPENDRMKAGSAFLDFLKRGFIQAGQAAGEDRGSPWF